MIIKEFFDCFTKEKIDQYLGKMKKPEDAICMQRSLDRLAFCNPVNTQLVALLVPYRPRVDRDVTIKLIFLPRWVVYEFSEVFAMEELESINIEKSYELALVCASQFHPVTFEFPELHLPVILGAEFVGPSEELADVFLGEVARRVKRNRRLLDMLDKPAADTLTERPEYLSNGMQMRIIKDVFLYNKLQLYMAIRNAARTLNGSA